MSTEITPLILAVDTATRAGSVSLARGAEILSTVVGNASSSHSTDLIENVKMVLRSSGIALNGVDLFAAAAGPGSFTGLRIGLATIKSFAVSTGKKCVGISTLAAIAHAAGSKIRTVAVLPAGRGEVFAQMFSANRDRIESHDSALHLKPDELLERYGQFPKLTWAGEGARVHAATLRAWADTHKIEFLSAPNSSAEQREAWIVAPVCDQLAISVALLALNEYRNGNVIRPDELHASYVRPSDAEIPKPWQQQK